MQYTIKAFGYAWELFEHLQSTVCMSRQMNHLLIYADLNLHCMQYIVKLKANIDNPAYDCVFNPQYENVYDKIKKCIKSIGFRIQKQIDDSNIPLDIIKPVSHSKIPPWKLLKSELDISL